MGFLDKVFSSKNEDSDIEEFLNNLDVKEEDMYENADAYVKPLLLTQEKDAQLAVEVHRVLDDAEWRRSMVDAGLQRARQYTPRRAAEGLLAAYRSVTAAL